MFAVTGITGQVGGAVARTLLAKGCGVRGVVRDANKAGSWAKQGCEIAVAD
jgi:NAD(P)H dehydrogenase (quinone)